MSARSTAVREGACAEPGSVAADWNMKLHRSFACAGRTVWVRLLPLRGVGGAPRFSAVWLPSPPVALPSSDIQHFDAEKRRAQAEILAYSATLQSA